MEIENNTYTRTIAVGFPGNGTGGGGCDGGYETMNGKVHTQVDYTYSLLN